MAEKPRIYYPVRPYVLNQPFGHNQACVRDFGKPNQSVRGKIGNVCPLGYEELYPKFGMRGHNGLDLRAGEQNCYAALEGIVVEKQTTPARGLGLGIMTKEPMDLGGNGVHYLKLRYWHLKKMYVEVGDVIKVGDLIGVTDTTGFSAGNHLHFEGQPMDKDAGGHPYLTLNGNGIGAAIDIEPFLIGEYAETHSQITMLQRALIPLLQKMVELLSQNKK